MHFLRIKLLLPHHRYFNSFLLSNFLLQLSNYLRYLCLDCYLDFCQYFTLFIFSKLAIFLNGSSSTAVSYLILTIFYISLYFLLAADLIILDKIKIHVFILHSYHLIFFCHLSELNHHFECSNTSISNDYVYELRNYYIFSLVS